MENTATVSGTEVKKYRRAGFMDEVRGFCILCMVVYHVCFDLNYTYNIHIPIMFDGWFDIVRDIFAGAFMFISGMSSRYSHNNAKRGIQCFFIGMIITFIFAFFAPSAPILFGILHFMGVSMMIYAIGDKYFLKIPAPVGIAVCAVLFLLTRGIMYGYSGRNSRVRRAFPINKRNYVRLSRTCARCRNKAARIYLQCRTSFSARLQSTEFSVNGLFSAPAVVFRVSGRRLHRKIRYRG